MAMSVNATFSVRLLFCFFSFTFFFIYLFIYFFELQYEPTKEDRIRKEITPQLLVKKGKRMGL